MNRSESPKKTPENKENPDCYTTMTKLSASNSNVLREEDQNTPSVSSSISVSMKSTQTPIEHIVSSSDIGMFQQAKEKAAEVMVRTLKTLESLFLICLNHRTIKIYFYVLY